jgi:putative inorganic carbon (hco3(-)) transporter
MSAASLPIGPPRARRPHPTARVVLPAAAAAVLGAAIAIGRPIVIALALVPLVAVAVVRPEGATLAFVAAFYLNLPVLASHATGHPVGSATAMLLLIPVTAYVVVRRQALVVTPALGLLVAYLVVLVLSATIAGGTRTGPANAIESFLVEGLLLYLLVTNAVRTPAMLRAVVWVLLGAGATMGAISLWQEATHAYHQTLGGLAQVEATDFHIGDSTFGPRLRPRLAGPIGEKNRYAQVLIVLLPLAVWAMRTEPRRTLRLAAGACGALVLGGMVLTFSRGAAVAFALLVLAMVAVRFVRLRHLAAFALALVVAVPALTPDYLLRLQSLGEAESALSGDPGAGGAILGRATENLAAYHVFRDHPLLGVGPGEFFRRYSEAYGNALNLRFLQTNRRAHNLYLEIAADTGLVGLAAFLAIIVVTMAQLWRLSRFLAQARPDLAHLATAFALALLAYLASGMFLQLAFQRYLWMLVALANATIWTLTREAARLAPSNKEAGP